MVKEVECTTCGRIHPIGESELPFKLPDVVFALSDKDRELRCQTSPDIVSLDDERFFIRGLLPLSVAGRERKYNVGVWAEVSIDVFELMEHGAVEFAGNNVKDALTCLSPKTRFAPLVGLHRGFFSLSFGTDSRGSLIEIEFYEDPEIGGMAFKVSADGY